LKHFNKRAIGKSIILLLMLFLLLFHLEIQVVAFKVFELKYKREVKQLIKDGIPESDLILFVFHKDYRIQKTENLEWIKPNEFRYHGEMYDIIREEIKGDSVYSHCFHDVKESRLFKDMDKYFAKFLQDNPDKENELNIVLNSFSRNYILGMNDPIKTIPYYDIDYFSLAITYPEEGYSSIPSPPPKCRYSIIQLFTAS